MSNVWKRTLSLFLAVVLVVGMIPGNLFTVVASAAEVTDPTTAAVGDNYVVKGSTDAPAASGATGTHWENTSKAVSCTTEEGHEHNLSDCYTQKCLHSGLTHSADCIKDAEKCSTPVYKSCSAHTDHYTVISGWSSTRYGGTCTHECSETSGCRINLY